MRIKHPGYNECMCDACMVKYWREGLIEEGTSAYEEVMKIMENTKDLDTKIIAGFPGVGKTVFSRKNHLFILDSDSSKFSWLSEGVRNPDFPNNYMQHIKENIGKAHYILVSSHDVVRKALEDNGIEYTLVYPSVELKEGYLQRYRKRGNDETFIKFIGNSWKNFISDIEQETFPKLVKLENGQFLSDVLEIC